MTRLAPHGYAYELCDLTMCCVWKLDMEIRYAVANLGVIMLSIQF